ncbi:MAG: substrate-binding domain-containing protein, partial [Chitinophagales bacterium]
DTPETGCIAIVADESFAPLLRNEIATFSSIYKEAKINVEFLPEMKVASSFFGNADLRLMVISRRLYNDEKKYFEQLGLPPHEIKIAIDAIAFVINTENSDSNFEYNQIAEIISGKITSWKEINPNSRLGKISVVFDNQQSSTVRFLSEKLLQNNLQLTHNAFAVDSNPAVIEYVEKDPASIGIIGVSWISDKDDSTSGRFLRRIRVAAVSAKEEPDIFYVPSKEFIYSMHYPFLRELFIVSQEKHSGLGTGFATYVASDEGQRIVQRAGLMPIDRAVRIIELKDQF